MSSLLNSSLSTGILTYSRKKDFLGPGFNFKETEFITVDCFITNFANFSPTILQNDLQQTFDSLYSGNIYCKIFQSDGGFNGTNDEVRILRFRAEIENRLTSDFTNQPEFSNSNYQGVGETFWLTYGPNFNSFSEDYNYSKKDDGTLNIEHQIQFSTLSGGYNLATGIASYIYQGDIGNAFYTNFTTGFIIDNINLIDPTQVRQYYTESYDLLKNNYSFNKKNEYPPILSANNNLVNKNIKNTIVLSEDGITTVSEEGHIKAYTNFNNAVNEFNYDLANNIFNRCNVYYNSFLNLSNNIAGILNNYPIKNDVVYNQPSLIVDYNISYNDNPNFNSTYDFITQKTIKIDLIEDKYIDITHSYDFTRIANISPIQTGVMMTMIQNADTESSILIPSYYSTSELYNPYLTNIPRIKESFTLPNRKRNLNASFFYSNQPIYFITIGGITYPKLEYKISDNIPTDMVKEYKIINRSQKTSVLSYQYQDSVGEKVITINGILPRQYGLTFTTPQNIETMFIGLFNWGVSTILNTFNGQNILNFTYYLNDVKTQFNSENEFTCNISIKYTLKKYYD